MSEQDCYNCKHENLNGLDEPCRSCRTTDKGNGSNWESKKESSDGSTANYYTLPEGATELQHLISYRNMNAQIGEILRACYRYGLVSHSPCERDIKKIIFYAQAELERLEKFKCGKS